MTRVGIVGADIVHALQYASILRPEHGSAAAMIEVPPLDPTLEAELADVRCESVVGPTEPWTRGRLDSFAAIKQTTVTCWWGAERAAAEAMANRLGIDNVVDRIEEMVDQVDAVLVCTKQATDREALVLPFLRAGIPTFVDKPLADSSRSAAHLVAAAKNSNTLLFSSSPWRWAPCVADLRRRLPELGGVSSVIMSAPAPGDWFFYLIHSVEMLQHLLGEGVRAVSATCENHHRTIVADWDDGRRGIINGMRDVAWVRHAVVYGRRGYLEAEVTNAHRDEGKIQIIVNFINAVAAGQPPLSYSALTEAIDVLVAAKLSAERNGTWVSLAEVSDDEETM